MTIPVQKPSRSDWVLIGIFWTAALPFVLSGYFTQGWARLLSMGLLEISTHLTLVLILMYVLFPVFLINRRYVSLFLLTFASIITLAVLYRLCYGALCDCTTQMDVQQVVNDMSMMGQQSGVLAAFLIGKHFFETQQRLTLTEKERTAAELRHLKAQIDPHFLFNNLNVLGSLIQRSPDQASAYLHRFSALYRYLIRHKDDDVVPLADELAFVTDYRYLIGQRFGRAFVFIDKIAVSDSLTVFMPPGSIQTLLENAVKHNGGDGQNPLLIELIIDEKSVTVRNDLRPKLTPTDSTGTGLANLRARYAFLSDQPVSVQQNAVEFVVTLPLLRGMPTPINRLTV